MPRLRTFIVPVGALALAAVGWTAVWHWGANRAEEVIDRVVASEAANGRVIQCAERSRGGYPFRLEINCTKPVVELRDESRPTRTIRLERLQVVSQIWSPGHVIAEWTGPMTATLEGDPSVYSANWRLAQTSAQLAIAGYDSSSAVVDAFELSRDGAVLLRATRGELHTRPNTADPVSLDVVSKLQGATVGNAIQAPVDAELQMTARKLLRSPNRPQPLAPRQWQAAGGSIDLVLFRVAQGDAVGLAKGNLRLTVDGKPDGQIELRVANLESAVRANGLSGTLGAVVAGLNFTSQATDVEGKPGRLINLRASEGRLQVGPIRIGLPALLP
ncbi:MAG: DUF2125 domain-containing protein [Phreatobacter sp.]